MGSATALVPTRLLIVQKKTMVRMLHEQHELADRFITCMLSRNIRIEEDLKLELVRMQSADVQQAPAS